MKNERRKSKNIIIADWTTGGASRNQSASLFFGEVPHGFLMQ